MAYEPTSNHPVATKGRMRWLDQLKGASIVVMCALHVFGLTGSRLEKIFALVDPYVFVTFSLCFGIGCGLSRRSNWWRLVGLLLGIYVLGGLLFAAVRTYSPDPSVWLFHFRDIAGKAAEVQTFFPYADFLPPYILFAVLLSLMPWLSRMDPVRGALTVGVLALAGASAGYLLAAHTPRGPLSAFYDDGFRCLQYLPLFAIGYLYGRVQRLRPLSIRLTVTQRGALWSAGLLLLIVNHLYTRHLSGQSGLWKLSGSWTYVAFGGLMGAVFVLATQDLNDRDQASRLAWLEPLGKNSLRALMLQMTLVPCVVFAIRRSAALVPGSPGRLFVSVLDFFVIVGILWLSWRPAGTRSYSPGA